MEPDYLIGRVTFTNNQLIPDHNMCLIDKIIDRSQLLVANYRDTPFFYYDPEKRVYWECIESEDYSKKIKQVDVEYIKKNYPHVEYWNKIDVRRPKL